MDSDKDSDMELDQTSDRSSAKDEDGWSTETMNKLIHQVMALTTPGETVPFNLRGIDWKMVSWGSHTAAKCEEKWKELLTKVRHYRTVFEVATDMITFLDRKKASAKVLHWNNMVKKKKDVKPVVKKKTKEEYDKDYPPKPRSSAYSIFSAEKMKKIDVYTGKDRMVLIGKEWSAIEPEEKQHYYDIWEKEKESYIPKLEEYSRNHPEDDRIKEIIREEKGRSKKARRRTSGSASQTSKQNENENGETEESDLEAEIKLGTFTSLKSPKRKKDVASTSKTPKKLPPPKKVNKESNLDHSQLTDGTQDSGLETTTTGTESPVKSPKKRKHKGADESTTEESVKKKKPKQRKVTGELLYVEQKREGYSLEHPDLEPEEVEQKLKRKYTKLSEKKVAKYEQLAAEMSSIS